MKVRLKGQDEKIPELVVHKWGNQYSTQDKNLPELKEKLERHRERNAGNTSMFGGGKKPTFKVAFGKKIKLPDEIKNNYARNPISFRLKNVMYRIVGNTLWVNWAQEVSN